MYAIDFTKLAGTSKLFLDFIKCQEPACGYFRYDFKELSSYRLVAEQIDKITYDREKLASIISGATSHLNLSAATRDNIHRLSQSDSLCVFAGQQAGLLLGPNYSILKALTAYKLARRLEMELGRPVIPCFWIATDDHDFAEVKTIKFVDREGQCKSISYNPAQPPRGEPVADIKLDSEIEKFISSVEEILVDTEYSNAVKGWIRNIYRPGKPLSTAFIELFETVMQSFGIVPVDPNFPGMKSIFEPVFRRDIEKHNVIYDIYEKKSLEITEAGYHRQVHKQPNALNLFINDGIRQNIIVKDNAIIFDGQDNPRFSCDELLTLLHNEPDRFSPNVTLRPIAQCFAFPTISQIVGPSEAAYFAQIAPLFDLHGVPWPVIRPRMFATLIEPQIAKILHKYKIDFTGLASDLEFEIGRVIRENYPSEIQDHAEKLRSQIDSPLQVLGESIKSQDLESFQAIDYTRRRIDHELNHLSKKLFMAHKKRHDEARQRVLKVAG
ncbi:MAG TPA: bacillithiol biosynthesis cysteine-adding enzyme BshC, partial [candidate division Zixibacteria bacterium]|nr:bacillithiol biosynthesis cysteine-adding enzyme BshC [candidate division Zixibacteria bacterium]